MVAGFEQMELLHGCLHHFLISTEALHSFVVLFLQVDVCFFEVVELGGYLWVWFTVDIQLDWDC